MARPQRLRIVCQEPEYELFSPDGIPDNEIVKLSLDEYETIRLIDHERNTQKQCADRLGVSRTTVTEIYDNARYKIADAIIRGKKLQICGGNVKLCDGSNRKFCGDSCSKKAICQKAIIADKGDKAMRVAVTYENENIFQHFGHTEQFKIYDIEEGKIVNQVIMDTNGTGHGALAALLADNSVDVLICGGIGMGAQNALADAGVKLYGGVSGNADQAVADYISGRLDYNPNVSCNHHEHQDGHCHEGSCGQHSCH